MSKCFTFDELVQREAIQPDPVETEDGVMYAVQPGWFIETNDFHAVDSFYLVDESHVLYLGDDDFEDNTGRDDACFILYQRIEN